MTRERQAAVPLSTANLGFDPCIYKKQHLCLAPKTGAVAGAVFVGPLAGAERTVRFAAPFFVGIASVTVTVTP